MIQGTERKLDQLNDCSTTQLVDPSCGVLPKGATSSGPWFGDGDASCQNDWKLSSMGNSSFGDVDRCVEGADAFMKEAELAGEGDLCNLVICGRGAVETFRGLFLRIGFARYAGVPALGALLSTIA